MVRKVAYFGVRPMILPVCRRARTLASLLGLAALSLLVGSMAAAQNQSTPGGPSAQPLGSSALQENPAMPSVTPPATKPAERLREGTHLTDEVGTFQNVGDRIAFIPSGDKDSYRVLENLALERIGRTLDDGRGQRPWVVSGVITEFRGSNFLLITKALIQPQEGDAAATQ
jgi:hypothetical protein